MFPLWWKGLLHFLINFFISWWVFQTASLLVLCNKYSSCSRNDSDFIFRWIEPVFTASWVQVAVYLQRCKRMWECNNWRYWLVFFSLALLRYQEEGLQGNSSSIGLHHCAHPPPIRPPPSLAASFSFSTWQLCFCSGSATDLHPGPAPWRESAERN